MTLNEIKQAIQQKKTVYYLIKAYKVTKTRDEYLISYGKSSMNLVWADGTTLNGREADFFVESE